MTLWLWILPNGGGNINDAFVSIDVISEDGLLGQFVRWARTVLKAVWTKTAAICLSLAITAPVMADETPRFKSSGFLESLDLFADQRASLESTDNAASRLKVDFAFRSESAAQEPGFLYLQDEGDNAPVAPIPVSKPLSSFTPRLSALSGLDRSVDSVGQTRVSGSFTPRYAGSRVTLGFAPDTDGFAEDAHKRFSLALSSEFLVERSTLSVIADSGFNELTPYDRQSMNLGLSVGYLGFTVGASVTRETGGLLDDIEGFDIGLGYETAAFSTQISVGEYSRNRGHNALVGLDDSFYKLELGAAYALSTRLRVSGGVRLFDYGPGFAAGQESGDRAGQLYLGTRFNF